MAKFHVSQDETGFYQLAYENDAGELTLVSHQFATPEQLIEDARELVETGEFGDALVVIGPSRPVPEAAPGAPAEYRRPAPRRAGE